MKTHVDCNRSAGQPWQHQYQALSTLAIVSLVLGILSILAIVASVSSVDACLMISPVPVLGIMTGIWALAKIYRTPDELTGKPLAIAGVGLSSGFLLGGLGIAGCIYITEVPEGYTRVAFSMLKPDTEQERRGVVVPKDLDSYNGQKVFLKGYIRPSSQIVQLDRFLLVRDNNECCFGDNLPAYYDQVQVHLVGPKRVNYSTRMFKVGGTLKIDDRAPRGLPGRTVYELKADYVK